MQDRHRRSLVKGITWRVVGTIDTIIISFLVTKRFDLSLSIGAIEAFTKVIIYYGHERLWAKIRWGKSGAAPQK